MTRFTLLHGKIIWITVTNVDMGCILTTVRKLFTRCVSSAYKEFCKCRGVLRRQKQNQLLSTAVITIIISSASGSPIFQHRLRLQRGVCRICGKPGVVQSILGHAPVFMNPLNECVQTHEVCFGPDVAANQKSQILTFTRKFTFP
jgi:hypothetical protein